MLELVPASLRRIGGSRRCLVLEPNAVPATSVAVILRRGTRKVTLGAMALDGGRANLPGLPSHMDEVTLRLPASLMLEQRVALPLAAERDPAQVLRFEMDRLTPFAADAVFWSWAPIRRDSANRRLDLLIRLVPKAPVQPLIAALAKAGLAPTALESAYPGADRRIVLGGTRDIWSRRSQIAAAALCAMLAASAIVTPFIQQELALREAAVRIAALRAPVAQVEALRTRLANQAGKLGAIATEQARLGDALQTLAALTETLPDDTYLTDLALRARRLTIGGRSDSAVKLIPLLASGRVIGNPSFLAPVTHAPSDGRDIFSITAEVSP